MSKHDDTQAPATVPVELRHNTKGAKAGDVIYVDPARAEVLVKNGHVKRLPADWAPDAEVEAPPAGPTGATGPTGGSGGSGGDTGATGATGS